MKTVEMFRSDIYSSIDEAREDNATYTTKVPESTTVDTVREIVELCGVTHSGDPAYFHAVLVTTEHI